MGFFIQSRQLQTEQCVVVAVILAILCAYSLWKKRRTLCGWGFTEHHTQSEGDSAGSCYAPPQYSRCNSFHHPPPPYTEVTSKPDLYPLVFTCNSDNSKGNAGSSYLMVQYFRNYIVRPAGSLSAASTVDSLSSSFICNINEANTLVPPPYSRAASPELSMHYGGGAHRELAATTATTTVPLSSQLVGPQYGLPRSASQLVEPDYQPRQAMQMHYATVALGGNMGVGAGSAHYSTRLHASHSGHFSPDESGNESTGGGGLGGGCGGGGGGGGGFLQSQSDQHFRYMGNNSSSSLSDIFVNNSCAAGFGGTGADQAGIMGEAATQATSLCSLAMAAGGTSVIYGNGCIQANPLHSLDNCCQVASTTQAATAAAAAAATATGPTTASTVSGVSSLSNIGTPSSPPQATSPTGEVREILDQISQLQADVNYEQLLLNGGAKSRLQHTLSTPMTRPATLQHQQPTSSSSSASASASSKAKKYYASKPPNKALYIPMAVLTPPSAQRCVLKSPISSVVSGANFFVNRGRVARKGWITRSAPTTPGSGLPPNRLGDDSPLLLNEHDEDAIDESMGDHGGQLE
ncbi:glycine, alanine and asparagine-rich protein isoform X2 [Drosophila grimshawi]|uniref:glycine, alanine and asparagine-rich protein isoform X2 n=1 Tax=Drosophila grimshawi TaxID=7222 RepID=UPI001C933F88|nr:glycine, alanine and asparagine-rich protein isoform X2 [Drosophila grimshawi]